ncbi:hypothetical protein GPK51_07595 [Eubacterium ventriosum]|nr:hypothetical protein [Eubacterium ventriosum]
MQGIFQKENTDKALKYGIYRHLPTYEKIIRNLVSFSTTKIPKSKLFLISGFSFTTTILLILHLQLYLLTLKLMLLIKSILFSSLLPP